MKILLTTPTYPPFNSGLGNAVQVQARLLVDAGHSVEIATGAKFTGSRLDESLGILIHTFNIQGEQSLLHPIRGDVQAYKLFLKSSKFDVLVFNAWQTWSTDIPLAMLDRISGRKFLYSHGISTNLLIRGDYIRSILRYILWRPYWFKVVKSMKKLDGLLFLSDRGVDSRFDDLTLAQKLQIDTFIAPNSISEESMSYLQSPTRIFEDRSGFISVGSYTWLKGHDFVLKAYAQSKYKNIIPLTIFGQKFTAYTDYLRALATELGINNGMVMFYEDISGIKLLNKYSESSIFICGSHTECQPLVLLDAMATGTPFISRSSGCIPFMSGGISVGDVHSAAIAINDLMDNTEMWQHFSTRGKGEITRRHHPNHLREAILKAILPLQRCAS